MYLKRKIDIFLIKRKENKGKSPLVINGSRQVGKTKSILEFANSNYDNFSNSYISRLTFYHSNRKLRFSINLILVL